MTTPTGSYLVSADHSQPHRGLTCHPVDVSDNGGTFVASIPEFGTGRPCVTPEAAIQALLSESGCQNVFVHGAAGAYKYPRSSPSLVIVQQHPTTISHGMPPGRLVIYVNRETDQYVVCFENLSTACQYNIQSYELYSSALYDFASRLSLHEYQAQQGASWTKGPCVW